MKFFLYPFGGVLVAALLGACTAPQTLPEFRKWARSSSHMTSKEYDVADLDLETSGKILRAFSNRCMTKEIRSSTSMDTGYGIAKDTMVSTYRPKVIKESNRVSLVIQRQDTNSIGYPPGGVYEFLAEITPAKAGGVHVFSSNFSFRMPDRILDDTQTWLQRKGHFCPF